MTGGRGDDAPRITALVSRARGAWARWAVVLVLALGLPAWGQEGVGGQADVTLDSVVALIAELEGREGGAEALSEEDARRLEALRQARQALTSAESAAKQAAEFRDRVDKGPEELAQAKRESEGSIEAEAIRVGREGLKESEARREGLNDRFVAAGERVGEERAEAAWEALIEEIRAGSAWAEERQRGVTTELQAAQQLERSLQEERTRRSARLAAIPDEMATLNADLAVVLGQIEAEESAGDAGGVGEARAILLRAQRREMEARIEALTQERRSYETREELLGLRLGNAGRRIEAARALEQRWQGEMAAFRDLEARAGEQLRTRAAQRHEVLRQYAEATDAAALDAIEGGGREALEEIRALEADARKEIDRLREEFEPLRELLGLLGERRITGRILRRQYETLRDGAGLREELAVSQRRFEEIEGSLADLEYRLRAIRDVEAEVAGLLSQAEATRGEQSIEDLTRGARQLVENRRSRFGAIVGELGEEKRALLELIPVQQELLDATRAFRGFIEERIFWVRSISGQSQAGAWRETIAWATGAASWGAALRLVREDVDDRWPLTGVATLFMLVLIIAGRAAGRRARQLGDQASGFRTDTMLLTMRALVLTVVMSLPMPAFFWWLGWVLERPVDQVNVADAVGEGLKSASLVLLVLLFWRNLLRAKGLAEAHFRWPVEAIRAMRRGLRWFIPVAVTGRGVFVAMDLYRGGSALDSVGSEAGNASLGRVAFTVSMVSAAWLARRLLRPGGPIVAEYLKRNPGGWIDRLRWVWFGLLVGIPLALVVASWLGYHYTALRLETRFEVSIALVMGLVLLNSLMLRWLFLARRRVAIEEAKRKREQALAEARGEGRGEGDEKASAIEVETLNLPAVSLQTRAMIRAAIIVSVIVGTYLAWAEVLPALRMLERVQVYPAIQVAERGAAVSVPILERRGSGEAPPPAAVRAGGEQGGSGGAGASAGAAEGTTGETRAASPGGALIPGGIGSTEGSPGEGGGSGGDEISAITLADVGLAIVILMATFLAFRNLPGLLEIVVLQRLPLDAGSRYALSTVLRYVIAIIGVVAGFGAMGIGWSNVQWLAAALTFGLAFGLQEIFANFVSGLIILAERPIRIGDTVTVGGVSGTVSRIRMRATTIMDWDRKELVVPNKQFITSEVTNWTLTDPIARVIVPVGAAYGSDVDQIERVLREVAAEAPKVLREPAAQVWFLGFGDSSLSFELRVFIGHVDDMLRVRHDLHVRVFKAFEREGIELAFPQMDLHVRGGEAIEALTRAMGEGASGVARERSGGGRGDLVEDRHG